MERIVAKAEFLQLPIGIPLALQVLDLGPFCLQDLDFME
jgi:hypothetical protein